MIDMAEACGFEVPNREFVQVDGTNALGIHRFDRERIKGQHYPRHYLSAKTLLGQYGETEVGSYPAFADELRRWSDQPAKDCHELFGRMLFSIATGNRDDHAKNHGALHVTGTTYRLAPAFDLVPMPQVSTTYRQAMIVGLQGQESNLANALSAVQHFMLNEDDAKAIASRVSQVVSSWRKFFSDAGVSEADMTFVQACFDIGRIAS
jgi:serine/threonine-protein kinase HipA